MPTPWESWPSRFAVTRFCATRRASRGSLPPAATIASTALVSAPACTTFGISLPSSRRREFTSGPPQGPCRSVGLDAAPVDDLRPAVDFLLHEPAEFIRRARDDVEADLVHALPAVRGAQGLHRRVVQPRDDFPRRLRRRRGRLPRGDDEAGDS